MLSMHSLFPCFSHFLSNTLTSYNNSFAHVSITEKCLLKAGSHWANSAKLANRSSMIRQFRQIHSFRRVSPTRIINFADFNRGVQQEEKPTVLFSNLIFNRCENRQNIFKKKKSEYRCLFQELRLDYREYHFRYIRMSKQQFYHLFSLLEELLEKGTTILFINKWKNDKFTGKQHFLCIRKWLILGLEAEKQLRN